MYLSIIIPVSCIILQIVFKFLYLNQQLTDSNLLPGLFAEEFFLIGWQHGSTDYR